MAVLSDYVMRLAVLSDCVMRLAVLSDWVAVDLLDILANVLYYSVDISGLLIWS